MNNTVPFTLLLKATGDAIADVLDSYKTYYSHITSLSYPQIINDVKALLDVVQDLENESAAGTLWTASPRAKENMLQLLNECGRLAKLLQNRIKDRNLRDDVRISQDIQVYFAEIECFLRTYSTRQKRTTDLSRAERDELDALSADHVPFPFCTLLSDVALGLRYDEAQREIAKLNSIIVDGRAYRTRGAFSGDSPTGCYCEARLQHIKRLHRAIACLGLRHPRDHGLASWEELKAELPHMLDLIKGIDKQLKNLEDLAMSASPTPSQPGIAHRRNQSEPLNIRDTLFPGVDLRQSSPTGSNFSSSRDSGSAFSATNKSWKRGSKAFGYSPNPGEWD
jgi:hypothetical protein